MKRPRLIIFKLFKFFNINVITNHFDQTYDGLYVVGCRGIAQQGVPDPW